MYLRLFCILVNITEQRGGLGSTAFDFKSKLLCPDFILNTGPHTLHIIETDFLGATRILSDYRKGLRRILKMSKCGFFSGTYSL